ncbi:hypothetical protein D9757_004652 [Collybiopsis confluens]|uniref:Pentatricopeptide repeat-containing protein n=1 Tax=Collybiopsis confluens TaxID=2823264 RepID=A0A8H5HS15_9AGAR|nr:hypothetical protein D9757_004652 [Collybiopsis confluens]
MSLRVALTRVCISRPRGFQKSISNFHRLASTASGSVAKYLSSLKSDIHNKDVIHRDYPLLTWEVARSQHLSRDSLLDREELDSMLEALAMSALSEDLLRMEQILSDMINVYNLPPTPETHSVIIRALIQRATFQTVKHWLEQMPKKAGGVKPTLNHYHTVLEAGPQFCSFKNMMQLVRDMRQSGCEASDDTFKLLAHARWLTTTRVSRIPLPADFSSIFQYMRDTGIPYNPAVADMLYAMYLDKHRIRYADEVIVLYNQIYADLLSPESLWENGWLLRFSAAVKEKGVTSGLKLLPRYLEEGGQPSTRLLGVFMQRISRFSHLCSLREKLDVEPSQEQWSMILLQYIKNGSVPDIVECYTRIRSEGVTPTAYAVSRLIQSILASPSEDSIDTAMKIFTDFTAELPQHCDLLPRESQRSLADLFSTLLQELSEVSQEKYADTKQLILREAEIRRISLQNASAYLTAISMNSARSEADAMEVYRESKHVLDEAGYLAVLDTLSRISWSDRLEPKVPTVALYFEVVKDMKAARFSVTAAVYLIILRSLGQLAGRTTRSVGFFHLRPIVLSVTRQTHDLITLDSSVTPTSSLWNALLDNYRRLESFPDALRVWDTMYVSRVFDRTSVNIILRTCREAGGVDMARQIKTKLEKSGFGFDNYNWKAWIACLCDAGRMNDALRDMCTAVKNPDPEMARIILGRLDPDVKPRVMDAIQKHQPRLHDALVREMNTNV